MVPVKELIDKNTKPPPVHVQLSSKCLPGMTHHTMLMNLSSGSPG